MIKLVKRFMQKPYEAKNKTDYIRHKLEQGHKVSQLGLYKMTERDGMPQMLSTKLSNRICDLKKQGMDIQTEMVTKGNVRYARYYI